MLNRCIIFIFTCMIITSPQSSQPSLGGAYLNFRTTTGNREKLYRVYSIDGSFRPRPYWAGEIWKRSSFSTVKPTVHTNPSRKRNFLFSKTLYKQEEFDNADFGRKTLWERSFSKRWRHDNHFIFYPSFLQQKLKMTRDCYTFSNFSGAVWSENLHLMRFQSETSALQIPPLRVWIGAY